MFLMYLGLGALVWEEPTQRALSTLYATGTRTTYLHSDHRNILKNMDFKTMFCVYI